MSKQNYPLILAPAGSRASFLAAVAAEADAIYCGLKQFSARMESANFSPGELAPLVKLAHKRGIKVYVAFNSMLKPADLNKAWKLLKEISGVVKPDALIIQDLSLIKLSKKAGFTGELHLSTLANVSFGAALKFIQACKMADKVVVPRELNIDEIKDMAKACPSNINLEVFIHGALCYGVSGRCYWSSYMGGKSGLRGRCVQPCRRIYKQLNRTGRFFSCQDLGLDVLIKTLKSVPEISTLKIEGRKKGPHYVYYTVTAYRMLRDHFSDSKMKKSAVELLGLALGRPTTHYNFLPQRPQNPVNTDQSTGSGLFIGKIKGSGQKPFLSPREHLLPGDIIRIGYEDEEWHTTLKINKSIPKRGRYQISGLRGRKQTSGVPVFLIDRREKELAKKISELEKELDSKIEYSFSGTTDLTLPLKRLIKSKNIIELPVDRHITRGGRRGQTGNWLNRDNLNKISKSVIRDIWWWLPPVIWPENESEHNKNIKTALKMGGRNFVLNAVWQMSLFRSDQKLNIWAGPFCNCANPVAIEQLNKIGFSGVVLSPELSGTDYMDMPKYSILPLGIVVSGLWPLSISRTIPDNLKLNQPFTSPKGEESWVVKHDTDFWIYPNWGIDLTAKMAELKNAGYRLFIHFNERIPKNIKIKQRPGIWNWNHGLQ